MALLTSEYDHDEVDQSSIFALYYTVIPSAFNVPALHPLSGHFKILKTTYNNYII